MQTTEPVNPAETMKTTSAHAVPALRAEGLRLVMLTGDNEGTARAVVMRLGVSDIRALCSGPGKLTEALGITHRHNALALDAPPFALCARSGKVDVVSGVRIGITKAVELPWRYGMRGSKFLSKPFASLTKPA